MTERTFLTTANTEAGVRKIADWYGWQAEEDNEGQIIIYTDIPEGAPQVAQEAAAIYGWDYDSDNLGAILLYTGVYSDAKLYTGVRDDDDSESYSDNERLS